MMRYNHVHLIQTPSLIFFMQGFEAIKILIRRTYRGEHQNYKITFNIRLYVCDESERKRYELEEAKCICLILVGHYPILSGSLLKRILAGKEVKKAKDMHRNPLLVKQDLVTNLFTLESPFSTHSVPTISSKTRVFSE